MSKRKIAIWVLSIMTTAAVLYIGAWQVYSAGVKAGAEAGIRASRDIGFTSQALQLRHLLSVSDDLEKMNVSEAGAMLDMLVYRQYIGLESDAQGGWLLQGTAQMKEEIERVRKMVRTHCETPRFARAEFDLCAEFAKRSNNAFQRTLEESRR